MDLPPQAARHAHRRHTLHALEPRRELVGGNLAERHTVVVALDAHAHDGLRGRIELHDGRSVGVLGHTAAHPVDLAPDVVRRLVQIGAPGEVQPDVGRPFRRGGADPLEAGRGGARLLDRPGDQILDLERPDARVRHADRDARHRHLGHQIDRQTRERDAAEQEDHGAHHEHHDGPADGCTRYAHGDPASLL